MKKLIIAVSMFHACASFAQTNWTFRWHGQEKGIVFQTNLTGSVKAAIRDDIALVMANIALSNAEFYLSKPSDPDYGEVDGLMNFVFVSHIRPDGFPIGNYKVINGMTNFLLTAEECSVYAAAIALTNQYASQISKLPVVILPFTNGFDVANMTLEQKGAYFFDPYLVALKGKDVARYEFEITSALPTAPTEINFLKPSALSYSKMDIEGNGKPLLACKLCRTNGQDSDIFIFVFKNGAWRWFPEIF